MSVVDRIIRVAANHLSEGTRGWDYLVGRGASPEQVRSMDVGYFPEDEWPPYIEEGSSEDGDRYRDWSARGVRLKDKLVFPLRNSLGKAMGFILRSPDSEGRSYREFRLKRAKAVEVFFGIRSSMEAIWRDGKAYLVEGMFDFFPVARVFEPTLCIGTAQVDPDQARFLKRFADEVYFLFDNDYQGNQGYEDFVEKHGSRFRNVERVRYRGDDPADAWRDMDDSAFADHLRNSLDPLGLGI